LDIRVLCAPDDGWKYHPKHVEQFPDINKLCNVTSCWIYEYTGILLGTRPILHISRIKFKLCSYASVIYLHVSEVTLAALSSDVDISAAVP
jgi:hypothetical protein